MQKVRNPWQQEQHSTKSRRNIRFAIGPGGIISSSIDAGHSKRLKEAALISAPLEHSVHITSKL
jgi:hypothetical protein